MLTFSLLVLILANSSPAFPITTTITCTIPKSFTISGFTKFTPVSSNPNPARVDFSYGDDGASVRTYCVLLGSTSTTIYDAPVACNDPDVRFLFEGSQLTIFEAYASCNATDTAQVKGSISVGTYCYPSPAGVPRGEGTQCQTPSVSLGGSLSPA
ncbi:uncharacterized protein RSE6_02741 [Rhynchosporium secalis]|uniref:AA1-like domain-containing protein n=1 Tax=Rhynchosporium secalis TaxID=38038 RepID=A0A1E1M100_RHYSE|nr:uncharacterized protein RSE6_02741 [Rhynchosporium secalis]